MKSTVISLEQNLSLSRFIVKDSPIPFMYGGTIILIFYWSPALYNESFIVKNNWSNFFI